MTRPAPFVRVEGCIGKHESRGEDMRILMAAVLALAAAAATAETWRVGVGKTVITPETNMWLAGYAGRKTAAEGKIHDLWAKAIAIAEPDGRTTVILTTDLLGLPASLSRETARLVEDRYGIPRQDLMLTSSHTHCGPVVRDNLDTMYGLADEQVELMHAYSASLPEKFLTAIGAAIDSLAPATLEWGKGHAGFAANRRHYSPEGGVQIGVNPIGPVDRDVPMLVARGADKEVKAVLMGYACHNTTLSFMHFCGDYAGFAQIDIEEAIPGATALFVSGCGADANPAPRGTIELARQHGKALADGVLARLKEPFTPVDGPVRAVYEEIPLPLSEPPSREEVEKQLKDENVYIQRRAMDLMEIYDAEGALPETYPYPIQVWQFAEGLQIIALGGEVVVDYSLLFNHLYGRDRQFTIGYANDVMAYIPSLRILREGGYEADSSMIYYGLHGPWAPTVEETLVGAVQRLAEPKPKTSFIGRGAADPKAPILVAHRGGVVTESAPECSAESIRLAARHGYGAVELDLRPSAEGVPYVFHDGKTDRACGVDGEFSQMNGGEIAALRFIRNGEKVLSLAEALRLCDDLGLSIMLDIKVPEDAVFLANIAKTVAEMGFNDYTICMNGDERTRAALKDIARVRVLDEERDALMAGEKVDLSRRFWFGLPSALPKETIAPMQAAGAWVIPAINIFRYERDSYIAGGEADIAALVEAGVDGFQIDSVYQHALGRERIEPVRE